MTPEIIQKIKSDIVFWEKEVNRCKQNYPDSPEHESYYLGMVDGMKEVLSYLETGRSASSIKIEGMIKKGLSHKGVI
jgi:hypothetical protein